MTRNCEIKSSLTMLDDHLYIGSQSAMNLSLLKKYKITHIINTVENNKDIHQVYASEASQITDEDSNNYKYLRFSAEDDEQYPIMDHFQDVFEFIENAYKEGGRCLIHCIMGINRSGVLATAYMMIKNNIGPFAAVKRVQRKRGRLLTNNAFISKLLIFAKTRGYLEKDQLFSLQSRWISDLKIFPKGMEVLQNSAPECIPYYNIIKDLLDRRAITIRETGQSKTEDRAPSLITENLYLGHLGHARNIALLKSMGITHLINTIEKYSETTQSIKESSGSISNKSLYEKENISYMGFTSDDDDGYPILKHFDDVFSFIETARQNNGKCLIHCAQGRNRSGVLATAYVMLKHKIDPISAVEHVITKRDNILSNGSFIVHLLLLASKEQLLEL
jgi:protein-tyrosine phosphatase